MSNKIAVVITSANHKHAGKPVAKGTRLSVDEATANALVAIGAGRIDIPAAPAKKETK